MRDDFTIATKGTLARRVGYRCSNPNCRMATSGPRTDPAKTINIGVAAHITAASEDGPRYDPALTHQQRQGVKNGIWLCYNCAKLIDNDPQRYTVEMLRKWKGAAEQVALDEIERRTSPQTATDSSGVTVGASSSTITPALDLSALRSRLNQGFDDPELDSFCMIHFPDIYDKFSRGMRKDEKINMLLDHCRRLPECHQRMLAVFEDQG